MIKHNKEPDFGGNFEAALYYATDQIKSMAVEIERSHNALMLASYVAEDLCDTLQRLSRHMPDSDRRDAMETVRHSFRMLAEAFTDPSEK